MAVSVERCGSGAEGSKTVSPSTVTPPARIRTNSLWVDSTASSQGLSIGWSDSSVASAIAHLLSRGPRRQSGGPPRRNPTGPNGTTDRAHTRATERCGYHECVPVRLIIADPEPFFSDALAT